MVLAALCKIVKVTLRSFFLFIYYDLHCSRPYWSCLELRKHVCILSNGCIPEKSSFCIWHLNLVSSGSCQVFHISVFIMKCARRSNFYIFFPSTKLLTCPWSFLFPLLQEKFVGNIFHQITCCLPNLI